MRSQLFANLLIAGVALLSLSCAETPAAFTGLPFIHDDYDAAIAAARKKDVPIFVDATAAWCHSCLSMQRYVFTDSKLAPVVDRYVWLELDMENPENAEFRERFPVEAFPTYFILDPRDERALIRWIGGCSVERVLTLLDEATLAYHGETPERLALADTLYAEGKNEEAITAYEDVFGTADPGAPYYARAVESLLFALSRTGNNEKGLALAEETLPLLRHKMCAGNIVSYGLDFAIGLPEDDPDRQKRMADMEAEALAIANETSLELVPDDRSGVYISLLGAREAAGDNEGYKMIAAQWAAFLNGAAAAAKTPAERAVFDSHRLSAYLELGEPAKSVPLLEQSERDFPDDYNPPARLAVAYRYMEEWELGVAASVRALSKHGTTGPRRMRILQNLARLHEAMGDTEATRRTLAEAVQHGESLPEGQRSESFVNALKKRLDALGPA
jgi:tetratricopeptide (TPR) repeat protein